MSLPKDLHVEAYGFAEFCRLMEDAYDKGYRFDFDSNAAYPTNFGAYYSAIVFLKEENASEDVLEPSEDDNEKDDSNSDEEVKAVAKKGRKAKATE